MNWNGCLSRINSLLTSMFRSPILTCGALQHQGTECGLERAAWSKRSSDLDLSAFYTVICDFYYIVDDAITTWLTLHAASIIIYDTSGHSVRSSYPDMLWHTTANGSKPGERALCATKMQYLQASQPVWCALCDICSRGPLLNQMMTTAAMAKMTTKRKTMLAQAIQRQIMNIRYMDAIWFNRHNKQTFAKKKPTKMHSV